MFIIYYSFCVINYRPQNHQELFNLRHARLRNVIERIFGVLKKRFKVLNLAQEYPFADQAKIVPAVAALHNFIVIYDPSEISRTEVEPEANLDDTWSSHQVVISQDERSRAADRRDRIAKALWADYIKRLALRRR